MRNALVLLAVSTLSACSGGEEAPPPPVPGPPVAAKPNVAPAKPSVAALPPLPASDVDPDSAAAAQLRDPFQTGENLDRAADDEATRRLLDQRRTSVPFSEVSVTDLHVRGTVNDGQKPRAIIVDSNGNSQMVSVGMIIGREVRDRKGAIAQWKVDRIHDGKVVLAQSGGSDTGPSKTHILANG